MAADGLRQKVEWLTQIGRAARTPGGRSYLRRLYLFNAVGRVTPSVAVQLGDLWYFVPTNDLVGKSTFMEGGFEHTVMEAALDLLAERLGRPPVAGRTFVDVGANIGTTTIPAVRLFGARHAIAIEPSSANCRLLRANIAANKLDDQVTVVELALSHRAGGYTLELGPDNTGDYRIRLTDDPGEIGEAGWALEQVEAVTFDELLEARQVSLGDIGLVWMDTQGHEAHVLDGASSLLASDVPVVAEYWPYGLRRAGALERLHAIVAGNYRLVLDVRATMDAGRAVELPAADVASLAERYTGQEYTDLALFK